MSIELMAGIICGVLIIGSYYLGYFFAKARYYSKGRSEGCKAIEGMVLDRAKGNPKYKDVWKDLLQ